MTYRIFNFIYQICDGKFLFVISGILIKLLNIEDSSIDSLLKLNKFKRRVLKIRFKLGYSINFLNLNLKEAYRFRVKYFIGIFLNIFEGDSDKARHYLETINHEDFISLLNLNQEYLLLFDDLKKNFKSEKNPYIKNRKFIGKTIILGPAVDLSTINISDYETIVFIKPPQNNNFLNKRIIVILNNIWIREKKESIINWLNQNPNSEVLSPKSIKGTFVKRDRVFDNILTGPDGSSPMGLQRALVIIENKYNFTKLELKGFDFSLSQNPYHKSYPSLLEKLGKGGQKDAILWSNSVHDFIYNILLTRDILSKNSDIKGKVREITQIRIEQVINLFESIYR